MKKFLCCIVLIGGLACLRAQTTLPITAHHIELIDSYEFGNDSMRLVLPLEYAKADIQQAEKLRYLDKQFEPYRVELVYTHYPLDYDRWAMTYTGLFRKRIENLIALDSRLASDKVNWQFYLQTACKNATQAKAMFHGFVVYYRNTKPEPASTKPQNRAQPVLADSQTEPKMEAPVPPVPYEFTTESAQKVKYKQKIGELYNMEEVKNVLRGEMILKDSTVFQILSRHPEWKNCLVVMDWTASMYTYGAQLLLWHRLNLENDISQVQHFVFFNDGDTREYGRKEIGKTGGIYKANTNSLEDVIRIMHKAMMAGMGGEAEENDIEALLQGINKLKHFDEVVLIADNSPVRDLKLLPQIKIPVRVLICDPYKDWVNPEYIRIAFETGGSLHTVEEDITRLEQFAEGQTKLKMGSFELKNGRVVRAK